MGVCVKAAGLDPAMDLSDISQKHDLLYSNLSSFHGHSLYSVSDMYHRSEDTRLMRLVQVCTVSGT